MLSLFGCLFPADESESVFVTIEPATALVSRGGTLGLRAHAWLTVEDGSTRPLEGATFSWSSTDPAIASVVPGVAGQATVTGVRSGSVRVAAVLDEFEQVEPASAELRVANTVEIDRVVPETVRFGEQLTIHAVGLGEVDRVLLGDARLIPDSGSFTGDSAGIGTMRFWVKAPAFSDRLLAVAREGFSASSPDTVFVIPEDVYETGDTLPVAVSLDGPPVRSPAVLFYNPALSIEGIATPDDSAPGIDNFRFTRSAPSRPLTIIIKASVLPVGRFEVNMHPFPAPDFSSSDWAIGVKAQRCDFWIETGSRSDSVIRVVEATTSSSFRLDVSGERTDYAIEVRDGAPAGLVPPDRFEYNDHCQAAKANFDRDSLRIDLAVQRFQEDLSIDRPFDIDWYEVDVGTESPVLFLARVMSLPTGAADSSDVDLLIVRGFDDVLRGATPGTSNEGIQFEAAPGRYSVLIVDQVGVPTRYSLCLSQGTACAPAFQGSVRQDPR
jgi:hypothetical protein